MYHVSDNTPQLVVVRFVSSFVRYFSSNLEFLHIYRVASTATNYQFYISHNETWQLLGEGEFFYLQEHPVVAMKTFDEVKARYIGLRATKKTQNNNAVGYAELDIITK